MYMRLKVLDVGCGTGRHSVRMAQEGAVVTGVDFSEGMLERARGKAREGGVEVEFVRHDIGGRLPFEDGAFDLVVCGLSDGPCA